MPHQRGPPVPLDAAIQMSLNRCWKRNAYIVTIQVQVRMQSCQCLEDGKYVLGIRVNLQSY